MLPLDLHVLSLPLAFILSQDQTLHCIILNLLACPDTYNFTKKLTLLDKLYFSRYLLLVLSFNLFNELFGPFYLKRAAKIRTFS